MSISLRYILIGGMAIYGLFVGGMVISAVAYVTSVRSAKAKAPSQAVYRVWKHDTARLAESQEEIYPRGFWEYSDRVAREQGVAVIDPIIMEWPSEKYEAFLPLVALLPGDEVNRILRNYQKNSNPVTRVMAMDLLQAVSSERIQNAVQLYRAGKP